MGSAGRSFVLLLMGAGVGAAVATMASLGAVWPGLLLALVCGGALLATLRKRLVDPAAATAQVPVQPPAAGLGSRVEQLLRQAEEEAVALRRAAEEQAVALRKATEQEADQLLAEARVRAQAIVAEAAATAERAPFHRPNPGRQSFSP